MQCLSIQLYVGPSLSVYLVLSRYRYIHIYTYGPSTCMQEYFKVYLFQSRSRHKHIYTYGPSACMQEYLWYTYYVYVYLSSFRSVFYLYTSLYLDRAIYIYIPTAPRHACKSTLRYAMHMSIYPALDRSISIWLFLCI